MCASVDSPPATSRFKQFAWAARAGCGILESQLTQCWPPGSVSNLPDPPSAPLLSIVGMSLANGNLDLFCGLLARGSIVRCWCNATVLSLSVPANTVHIAVNATGNATSITSLTLYSLSSDGLVWHTAINGAATLHWPVAFGTFIHITSEFALRSDLIVVRLTATVGQPVIPVFPYPVSRIASLSGVLLAIRHFDSQLVISNHDPLSATGSYSYPYARAYLSVDPQRGDDVACMSNHTVPCKTLSSALSLIRAGPTTVYLSGDRHVACNIKVSISRLTIESLCSEADDSCVTELNCDGCASCLQFGVQSDFIFLRNFTLSNSTVAAITYFASMHLQGIAFVQHAGSAMYQKDYGFLTASYLVGTLTCIGCTFQNNTVNASFIVHAGSVTLQSCVFRWNTLAGTGTLLLATQQDTSEFAPIEAVQMEDVSFIDNQCLAATALARVLDIVRVNVTHLSAHGNRLCSLISTLLRYQDRAYYFSLTHSEIYDNSFSGIAGISYQINRGSLTATLYDISVHDNDCSGTTDSGVFMFTGGGTSISTPLTVEVHGSSFLRNLRGTLGGVFRLDGANVALQMRKSTFIGNSATYGGGAIAISRIQRPGVIVKALVLAEDVSFVNQTCHHGGGAVMSIAVESINLTLSRVLVSGSTHELSGNGAVMVTSSAHSSVKVADSVFEANVGTLEGGALNINGMDLDLSISSCNFSSNEGKSGGAVFADVSSIWVLESRFSSNVAMSKGGAVALESTSFLFGDVKFCTFSENAADVGGALSLSRATVDFITDSFLSNRARTQGGAIFIGSSASPNIAECIFQNNSAIGPETVVNALGVIGGGGAIAVFGGAGSVGDSEFSHNFCVNDQGGAVSVVLGSLRISRSTFDNCSATHGGAVGVSVQGSIELYNSNCTRNEAKVHGGALFASEYESLLVSGSSFTDNRALTHGGGIYLERPLRNKTQTTVMGCELLRNTAAVHGGGGYFDSPSWSTLVQNLRFESNVAMSGGGGGFYCPKQNYSFDQTLAVNNTAYYGNVSASGACALVISNADAVQSAVQHAGFYIIPMISVSILDCYGQVVRYTPLHYVTVSTTSMQPTRVLGTTTAQFSDGEALFPDLSVVYEVPDQTLVFSSPSYSDIQLPSPLKLRFEPCPAGYWYSPWLGACDPCDVGTASVFNQSGACTPCAPGYYSAFTGQATCVPCDVGTYSNRKGASVCEECSASGSYTLQNASTRCQPCTEGLACENGLASIADGFWGYLTDDNTGIATAECMAGYCKGGLPVHGSCAAHRVASSPLCGQCDSGYVAYASNVCVHCPESNAGMVFVVVLLQWLFVLGVMYLSNGRNQQTAELKVLFFFVSSARIIFGTTASWTQWLGIVEGGNPLSLDVCIFNLTPYNQILLDLSMPLLGLLELLVTAALTKLSTLR